MASLSGISWLVICVNSKVFVNIWILYHQIKNYIVNLSPNFANHQSNFNPSIEYILLIMMLPILFHTLMVFILLYIKLYQSNVWLLILPYMMLPTFYIPKNQNWFDLYYTKIYLIKIIVEDYVFLWKEFFDSLKAWNSSFDSYLVFF